MKIDVGTNVGRIIDGNIPNRVTPLKSRIGNTIKNNVKLKSYSNDITNTDDERERKRIKKTVEVDKTEQPRRSKWVEQLPKTTYTEDAVIEDDMLGEE